MAKLAKTNAVMPYHGRTSGGTNFRNVDRDASLAGMKEVVWDFQVPVPQTLGTARNLGSIAAGGMIWDDGTSGTAWSTAFPGVPCTVLLETASAASNSEVTVRLAGYDQFDRLVEEEISCSAAKKDSSSEHAYKELVQCELVSKAASPPSSVTLQVSGTANLLEQFGTSGVATPCCRIGLPCILPDPRAIKAVLIGSYSGADLSGYVRQTSDNVWSVQNIAGAVDDYTNLTDAQVMNLGAGTMLLPGFGTAPATQIRGVVIFDRDYTRNFM